jgi:hypothetical protein
MAQPEPSRDVSAKVAVECIRSSMSNRDIMEKFQISSKGFADLLKKLLQKKLITEQDLANRGINLKFTKKPAAPAKGPKQVPILAPKPVEGDTEFLDTVTLTEMLSSSRLSGPPAGKEKSTADTGNEEDNAGDKKSKGRLTGLFKKTD